MDDLGFTLQERPWLYARCDMLALVVGSNCDRVRRLNRRYIG